MADEPVLRLRNVSKRFGRRVVLDGLNLEVMSGDIYGFLGPNGAGKTTTIRIATGLIRATSGEVRLFGKDVRRHPSVRARLGAVVEIPEFYGALGGLENLRIVARLSGIRDDGPVMEVLETVELTHATRQRVDTYSQGMRQRLGLAQALLGWPDLVILDEPTNGLDPRGVRDMRQLILDVSEERGITFLISSHLLYEVEILCDRLSIIDEGRLVEEGRTEEILAPEPDYYKIGLEEAEKAMALLAKAGYEVEAEPTGPDMIRVRTPGKSVAEVNAFLVREGFDVLEVSPVRPSLEDHFLRRTGTGEVRE
jgi:ABC-type multidrug transport system ATPase subunit